MRISPCSPRETRTTVSTARSTLAKIDAASLPQGQACFRQFDTTRLAPEQLRAEILFEQFYLLAERGLLNAKPRCGAGDVQFLGDD